MSIYLGTQRLATNIAGDAALSTSGGALTGNLTFQNEGTGIIFQPHTGAGTVTSSLLDDYEDGTWTLGILGNAGTVSNISNNRYVRVGSLVHVQVIANLTTTLSFLNENILQISGLPFIPDSDTPITLTDARGAPITGVDTAIFGSNAIFIEFDTAQTDVPVHITGTYDTDD